jgi:indolepyruvate ferredoxin oxidoreductase alpha subunit
VSHAAVLCPSFYRAGIVHNPDAGDRRRDRWRRRIIGWLQRRIDRRLEGLAA